MKVNNNQLSMFEPDSVTKDNIMNKLFESNNHLDNIITIRSTKLGLTKTFLFQPSKLMDNVYFCYALYNKQKLCDVEFYNNRMIITKNPILKESNDMSYKMAKAFLKILFSKEQVIPDTLKYWYPVECKYCGHLLTDPESIERGYRDKCNKKQC